MFSSGGENIFIAQSKLKGDNKKSHKHGCCSKWHSWYESGPGFDLIQNCVFSDISKEDMINASQVLENIGGYLKPLN